MASLTSASGFDHDRVVVAVASLERDGIVRATRSALAGTPRGLVRLPD